MTTKDLIKAVKRHAISNYNTDGWDVVVECYTDEELGAIITIGNCSTEEQAIAAVLADVKPYADFRDEIRAERF